MDKILSICIASYNKAEITTNLVKSLLTCDNPELEIVVVDNASTDDTIESLSKIRDERLRVKCNEKNIGGVPNMVEAWLAGQGQYGIYTNDRDVIYPEKLNDFISYLKSHPHVGGGQCVRNIIRNSPLSIEYQGKDAILNMAFRDEHPTGFFFKRELLDSIPKESLAKYTEPKGYSSFVWENILCEIICKGYVVVKYNNVIWHSTGATSSAKYISGSYKIEEASDRWFFPGNCLRRTIGNTDDILRLCKENSIELNIEERYQLYAHLLVPEYTFAVYRYKVIYESRIQAYHYKVRNRKVGREEMDKCRSDILNGYINYVRNIEKDTNELERLITASAQCVDKNNRMTIRKYLSKIKKQIKSIFG